MRSRWRAVALAAAAAIVAVALPAGASGTAAGGTAGMAGTAGAAGTTGMAGTTGAAAARTAVAGKLAGEPAQDPVLVGAAKRFGLSEAALERALVAVKTYLAGLGSEPKRGLLAPVAVAVFAKNLGIPVPQAQAVLRYLQAAWAADGKEKGKEKGKSGSVALPPAAVAFFARTLHVSVKQARTALDAILKLADKKGLDPKDPVFVKIATSLGVAPQQLLDALVALKKYLAEHDPGGGKGRGAPALPKEGAPAEPKSASGG
jgi:hypothetical protein